MPRGFAVNPAKIEDTLIPLDAFGSGMCKQSRVFTAILLEPYIHYTYIHRKAHFRIFFFFFVHFPH